MPQEIKGVLGEAPRANSTFPSSDTANYTHYVNSITVVVRKLDQTVEIKFPDHASNEFVMLELPERAARVLAAGLLAVAAGTQGNEEFEAKL